MDGKETFVQFEEVKRIQRELEDFTQTKIKTKINELNEIINHIEQNWRGANSEKYRKQIEEINTAIDEFRINTLSKIVDSIENQTKQYSNIENN